MDIVHKDCDVHYVAVIHRRLQDILVEVFEDGMADLVEHGFCFVLTD